MLTKKQLSQAVQTYARKHGFSTSTVRATTDLRQKAIEAYNAKQDRRAAAVQRVTIYVPQNSGLRDQLGAWGHVIVSWEFYQSENLRAHGFRFTPVR